MRYSDFKRGWAVRPVLGSGFTKPSIHTHPWWSCRSVPFPAAHLWGKSALLTYSSHSVSTGAYLWQKKTTKNKKKKKQKKKQKRKKTLKCLLIFIGCYSYIDHLVCSQQVTGPSNYLHVVVHYPSAMYLRSISYGLSCLGLFCSFFFFF